MQQNNIAKHMYSEVHRNPKPDVLQEKASDVLQEKALESVYGSSLASLTTRLMFHN